MSHIPEGSSAHGGNAKGKTAEEQEWELISVSGAVLNKYCTVIMCDGELSAVANNSMITHDEPVFSRFFQYSLKFF